MISLKRSILRLQLLQVLAVALSIVIQPWLAQHLGPFAYGRLVLVVAVTAYFVLFCDFGFGWSATRLIAAHRTDRQKCSELVWSTFAAKLLLYVIGFAILLGLIGLVDEFRREAALLMTAYVGALGAVLSPSWYFQATERPHIGYYLDLVGRLASLGLIVVGVTRPIDLWFAVISLAAGQLLSGMLGIALAAREPALRWAVPRLRELVSALGQGAPLFLSMSAISTYTAASGVILGLLSTREEVAYFGAAQRIVGAGSLALNPLNQAFYPRISYEMQHNHGQAVRSVRLAFWVHAAFGLPISAAIFMFADELTRILFGSAFAPAAQCLKWMAPIPFLVAIASVFANFVIMTMRRDRLHVAITLSAAAINVGALALFARSHGSVAAAAALMAAEVCVVLFAAVAGARLLRKLPRGGTA